jgi:hypothetical protein
MELRDITSTFFVNLLSRLGVKPPPSAGFQLVNTVQPVSIVDQDVALNVIPSTSLLDTPFTNGVQVAPVAGTVIADTGAQPQGAYTLFITASIDSAGNDVFDCVIARRNAANTADVWLIQVATATGNVPASPFVLPVHIQLSVNERVVVRVGAKNVAAGVNVLGNIWLTPG